MDEYINLPREQEKTESSPGFISASVTLALILFYFFAYQISASWFPIDMLGISWIQFFLLGVGIPIAVVILIKKHSFFYELLASVHFAVLLGLTLCMSTFLGCLIPQRDKTGEIQSSKISSYPLIKKLGLENIFFHFSFEVLLFLLLVGLVLVTIKRKQFLPEKWGFLSAHMGVVLLLIGGWYGREYGMDGSVDLQEGEAQSSFKSWDEKDRYPLGFSMMLHKFSQEYYPSHYRIEVLQSSESHGDFRKKASFNIDQIEKNRTLSLPGDEYQLKILQYFSHFREVENFVEVGSNSALQAQEIYERISLRWRYEKKENKQSFLPHLPMKSFYIIPDRKLLVLLQNGVPEKGFEKKFRSGQFDPTHNLIFLHKTASSEGRVQDSQIIKEVVVGQEYTFEKFKIKVLRFLPHCYYDREQKEYRSQSPFPGNPAIEISVNDAKEEIDRLWLFSLSQKAHSAKAWKLENRGIQLSYQFLPSSQGFPRYLLIFPKTREWIDIVDGKIINRKNWGEPYSIPSLSFTLFDVEVSQVKKEIKRMNFLAGKMNPATEVLLLKKGKIFSRKWLFPQSGSSLSSPDQKLILRMVPFQPVKSYQGHLSLFKEGKKVAEKVVQINDPLWYQGYSFYLSEARGHGRYNIRVVYDPGLEIALLGMFLVAFGVPYIFYLQPILRQWKKKEKKKHLNKETKTDQ